MSQRTFVLRTRRVQFGHTQEDMARRVGIALASYKQLENDEGTQWRSRTLQCLIRTASVLEMSPVELLPSLGEVPEEA